ncbi:MAG: DegV family protein [Clostridiales bacterium]|nr:DegV family protein [Clostridiales bacterium]
MNIKITADSTCDLSPDTIKSKNITIFPLRIVMNNSEYEDGVSITPSDIFSHVASGGELGTKAAVSIAKYREAFEQYSKEYDAVIHVNIGSLFSSCHQNALIAAEGLDNVYCIDSENLSTGQGLIVLEACDRAENCSNISVLCDELRSLCSKVETSFILSKLEYIVKGGRCSSVAALGANILHLKPCIEVIEGKMKVVKKYRGSFSKCLAQYITDRLEDRDDIDYKRLFVTRTPIDAGDLNMVEETVSSLSHFREVHYTKAGCTISFHCGPGALGVLFIRK